MTSGAPSGVHAAVTSRCRRATAGPASLVPTVHAAITSRCRRARKAIVAWVALLAFLRSGRIWLPYYLVGAVGFAVGLVLLGRGPIPLELALAGWTAEGAGAPPRRSTR